MHEVNQIRSDGVIVQISQSEHRCVSPGSGSENGAVSMWQSAGLTMRPIVGSVIVGVFGGVLASTGAVNRKATAQSVTWRIGNSSFSLNSRRWWGEGHRGVAPAAWVRV